MNPKIRNALGFAAALVAAIVLSVSWFSAPPWTLPQVAGAGEPQHGKHEEDEKPADNSMCYVCHLSLQTEEITDLAWFPWRSH